ncbi:hypothetical protein OROHE_018761 [Orobanche hederae]
MTSSSGEQRGIAVGVQRHRRAGGGAAASTSGGWRRGIGARMS